MKHLRKITWLGIFLLTSGAATAAPIEVVLDGDASYADVTIVDCWGYCAVSTSIAGTLDGLTFSLSDSAPTNEETFDFFSVTVGGFGIGEAVINASLAFIAPEIFSADSEGNSIFGTIRGIFSGGALVWDEIDAYTLADGSILTIVFEDLLEIGIGNSTMVSATVTRTVGSSIDPVGGGQKGGTTAVPEPGTLALFGLGLLALGFAQGRKRRLH